MKFAIPNQSLYRRFARWYDALFEGFFQMGREQALSRLDIQPGERLLVSGIGTGLDIPLLPQDVVIIGIDFNEAMLAVARQRAGERPITLLQMDAQNLLFEDAAFDAALLNLIVSVAPDGNRVFREAWRTLKSGGRVALFDKFAPESGHVSLFRRLAGVIINWFGTDINRRLSDILAGVDDAVVEHHETVMHGVYHILLLRKP